MSHNITSIKKTIFTLGSLCDGSMGTSEFLLPAISKIHIFEGLNVGRKCRRMFAHGDCGKDNQ